MSAKRRNHRWGEKNPLLHKSERECLNGCGIVKVTHHQVEAGRDIYWTEFYRGLDKIAGAGERTPVCEKVEVEA